jgi:hypothetical protein
MISGNRVFKVARYLKPNSLGKVAKPVQNEAARRLVEAFRRTLSPTLFDGGKTT